METEKRTSFKRATVNALYELYTELGFLGTHGQMELKRRPSRAWTIASSLVIARTAPLVRMPESTYDP